MAEKTGIAWTESTFNPWRGCVKVSAGCTNCYAEKGSQRNHQVLGRWGVDGTRVLASQTNWNDVERWNAAAVDSGNFHPVFCASYADVFEDWPGQLHDHRGRPLVRETGIDPALARPFWEPPPAVGYTTYTLNDARARLWQLIRDTPRLTWQLLTKRPENVRRMMPPGRWDNVWLGTTVESPDTLWRSDALKDAPQDVPVRFLSCEPLLAAIDLFPALDGIQWVIVGGESGSKARPFELPWLMKIVADCNVRDVPVFVKQFGRNPVGVSQKGERVPLEMTHDPGKGTSVLDWPWWARVQRFPTCVAESEQTETSMA